jgi:hypothetical protein
MAEAIVHPIDATLVTLASALRLAYADDAAAVRAVDRAVDHLASGLPFEFDGTELRITSYSRRAEGAIQISDGHACTCESSLRLWCWHRIAYRLLLAEMALRNPTWLRAQIAEQVSPAGSDGYDDAGNFLDQPFRPTPARELTPVAGSRFAQAQDAADRYFA